MKRRFYLFIVLSISVVTLHAQEVTLEQAVEIGIQKNYDVRIFQKTRDIAANDNNFAFGAFLPFINATGNYSKINVDSRTVTFAGTEVTRQGALTTNTNGSVQLLWTLFDGTRMFATRKRVEELAVLGEVNLRNQMINSTATIITNYYNIIRQKQVLRANQELMKVSEERVKLAEKKLQVGTGGKPELLQAKVDLNSQKTTLIVQETFIQQLKDQLNGLLGMGLPDVYDVADTIPINLTLTLDEIVNGIETTNQTLVAARKSIDIASLVVKENKASRSPIINFVSSYNFNQQENELATNQFALQFSRSNGLNYGLQVSVPIMNGMNVNRLVKQSKINLDRQQIIYDQQLMLAIVGVRNAYVNYDNAKKILLLNEQNILLARENVFIALEGFKRGVTTALDLRTAQQSLADAYNLLIGARYNAKISETELLRLKGALLN
ncbi:TolC family protein [soil metagenome]